MRTLELPFKITPFKHQLDGVWFLLERPYAALFDEMGLGKSKQVIDAACELFRRGWIDTVVVVAPASVRSVWLDPDLGELEKHSWGPWISYEFHRGGLKRVKQSQPEPPRLAWVVTNYEYIRRKENLQKLLALIKNRKVFLVIDEGVYVKSHSSLQTKAVIQLRKACQRVVILNGTPVANNPTDLFSQMMVLDGNILGCRNFWAFRNYYCVMGGYLGKQIIGYQHIPDLQNRIKPYVLRRIKSECLDLPPKIYTQYEVKLSPKTWQLYREMRDNMVAWLDNDNVSVANQAVVKLIRLSQLTSGFLGGLEGNEMPLPVDGDKRKFIVEWVKDNLAPGEKLLIWCRFRAEQEEIARELSALGYRVGRIHGGQKPEDRAATIKEFQTASVGTMILVGQQHAGGFGLNLTSCSKVIYASNDYSLMTRLQSEDRIHRPGQTSTCEYFDLLAVGPDGQATIDKAIVKALRKKEDIANWTTSQWKSALQEE